MAQRIQRKRTAGRNEIRQVVENSCANMQDQMAAIFERALASQGKRKEE